MIREVTTISGNIISVKDCKKINNQYYQKNVDCVLIGEKWYAKSKIGIKYDNNKKIWCYDKYNYLTCGIIGYENDDFVQGWYTPDIYENCQIRLDAHHLFWCISPDVLPEEHFVELLGQINRTYISKKFAQAQGIRMNEIGRFTFKDQGYNIEECLDFRQKLNAYAESPLKIEKSTIRRSRLLEGVTFGAEVETTAGIIPIQIQNKLGIVICKDGSIGYTPEYTTVPYSGAKGLQALKSLFIELEKRCQTNDSCSLHYHFGNIRNDREYLLAFYKMFTTVQSELFLMLPYYKREHYNLKNKNYNKFLLNLVPFYSSNEFKSYKSFITHLYRELYTWLNDGVPCGVEYNRKNKLHAAGSAKWNRSRRYFACNFINMIFSDRKTIEFRLSHAVLNSTKGINWFFICLALIKFADKNSSKILTDPSFSYTLKDVFDVYPNGSLFPMSDYLYAYFQNRKQYHANCKSNGDAMSRNECREINYTFTHSGITELY